MFDFQKEHVVNNYYCKSVNHYITSRGSLYCFAYKLAPKLLAVYAQSLNTLHAFRFRNLDCFSTKCNLRCTLWVRIA